MATELYPIGIQSFEVLRKNGYTYVDKTDMVYKLTREPKCFFLSRPRRFGKSLFLSTIEAYFKGRKSLFEGLAIYNMENDWVSYPVLHLDFSIAEGRSTERLSKYVETCILRMADEYGVTANLEAGIGPAFGFLIEDIAKKTGKPVVILIDEYDKGIVDVLDEVDILEANQDLLQPFFSQIKAQNANIRFCFITGVARFRHYTLFSGFNNPQDLSMNDEYSAICGITLEELQDNFQTGIQILANRLGVEYTEVIETLKQKYDGYRFSRSGNLVFNPFSILNCLSNEDISNYWIKSGTSRVFITYLTKSNFDLADLTDMWATKEVLEGTFDPERPIPLLFQTGYLTIKDYDDELYRLDIPNGEVRSALVKELIPQYMGIEEDTMPRKLQQLRRILKQGDANSLMQELTSLIAGIPYHEFDYNNIEKTYHLIIYSIFLMIGVDVRSEIAMSGGRIDMVAKTNKYVYVMEFKLDGTAQLALNQIDERGYALPWQAEVREVIKIGISFSSKTRTINDWMVKYQN